MIQAGQIYFVPEVELGKVNYGRPCLVLRVNAMDATVCYFSTQLDLNVGPQVMIETTDPDFPATGLSATSCIINDLVDDVPLDFFNNAKFRGDTKGEFKKRAEDWYGLPIG